MSEPTRRTLRRAVVTAFAVSAMALVAACVPPPTDPGTPTTTPPTTAPNTTRTVSNATFEWTFNQQVNKVSQAPGQYNYWSAGITDSTAATYVPTNGNATVLKKNASGAYVPIGSEAAVNWANKGKDGAGNTVTTGNQYFLGQKVRFTNGTGTVNTATGASSIQWTGTFSINFYGSYTPFWIVDPKLTVNASGVGTLTAAVGGIGSDIEDPTVRVTLPNRTVTLATIPAVYTGGAIATGFTKAPSYLDQTATSTGGVQVPKSSANAAFWGAFPQSFINFADEAGHGAYWFTSGGAADVNKVPAPISVAYTLNP